MMFTNKFHNHENVTVKFIHWIMFWKISKDIFQNIINKPQEIDLLVCLNNLLI